MSTAQRAHKHKSKQSVVLEIPSLDSTSTYTLCIRTRLSSEMMPTGVYKYGLQLEERQYALLSDEASD
ncbi:hypothetical protein M404DRAFT_21935 [Pisolithus tinctorius Marx 270]|uniref:Uncharacterized protein n=1 Tax=Pisolithus tinctorius Marx 270 TaxID=870435 RepID=A0A0C3JJV0_PISTI|nr:hypothetical protein M404DRAFT_21935 [Pisolithus tinctorius Marx 270]